MRRKRILLFSLLFLVLTLSFLYYALPNVLYRPRRDSVPSGAYVVPWMRPNPSIEVLAGIPPDLRPWNLDAAMAGALRLDITFSIGIPNETRVVPSVVYLGHDADYLYVGGKFSGMGPNPISTVEDYFTSYFNILFDVANDGVLTFPESGSELGVSVQSTTTGPHDQGWSTRLIDFYEDCVWRDYIPVVSRGAWDFASNNGMSVFTGRDMTAEYDDSSGTLVILFARYLWRPGYYTNNALQMRPGERWVMGFLLELGFTINGEAVYSDYVDGWPRNTYPYLSNDASWWPKLAIDLANPPASFSNNATPEGL